MSKTRKQAKQQRWSSSWIIVWGLTLGCWIWYNSAKISAWLQHGPLYGQLVQRQRIFREEIDEFRQEVVITEALTGIDERSLEEQEENTALDEGTSEVSLKEQVENHDGRNRIFTVSAKHCASMEEMGEMTTAKNTKEIDLNLRRIIQEYIAEHGARRVRTLSGEDFCTRKFVYGRANEDGFGNEMYKILNAAGLALMLNRSLIVGEDSSQNPGYLGINGKVHISFGDYISFSNETFTMREVKHLWVIHECAAKHKRSLSMRIDSIQRPSRTYALCDDWSQWSQPIIWFHGAQDAVALQLFLKSVHSNMKDAAIKILGDPFKPSTRANIFGELMQAFISPKQDIVDAVQWALGYGRDPDIALHLRMLNSRSRRAIETACICIQRTILQITTEGLPRVVIVTDTPAVVSLIRTKLETFAEVIHFDYRLYLNSSQGVSNVMKEHYFQPPRKRVDDWGPFPRWVALVDFFLASKARYGVVSGGSKRVATTYAQLIAALAAANPLDHSREEDFKFYSSFHPALVSHGLSLQQGWGHAWRTFGGKLSCANQTRQCALTSLLPHAWWDSPWQLPTSRDVKIIKNFGIDLDSSGNAVERNLANFCRSRKRPKPRSLRLELPPRKLLV